MAKTATLKKPSSKKPNSKKNSRLREMLEFDLSHIQHPSLFSQLETDTFKTPTTIIGIDEVGRGCLAGPVVAAAVILPPIAMDSDLACKLQYLNDSKALTPALRKELSLVIKTIAIHSICEASVDEIDTLNILHASLLAMKRARLGLLGHPTNANAKVTPSIVLIDGNKTVPGLSDIQMTVIKGDSLSASIAAASIIAKVYRDELMCTLAQSFPHYQWQRNKGYGSKDHLEAITKIGISPWHRRSFRLPVSDPEETYSDINFEDSE